MTAHMMTVHMITTVRPMIPTTVRMTQQEVSLLRSRINMEQQPRNARMQDVTIILPPPEIPIAVRFIPTPARIVANILMRMRCIAWIVYRAHPEAAHLMMILTATLPLRVVRENANIKKAVSTSARSRRRLEIYARSIMSIWMMHIIR